MEIICFIILKDHQLGYALVALFGRLFIFFTCVK